MAEQPQGIFWEAYEHPHGQRKSDWFWVLGILTLASSVAAILLGNVLLGVLLIVGGAVTAILASRAPKIVSYAVTQRGLRIDDRLYPYTTLEAFFIDEDYYTGPQLLIRSGKMFMPLLTIPLPMDALFEIEEMIAQRIPEEHIEEPLAHKLLEFFKF